MFNTYKQRIEELERLKTVSNIRNFSEGILIGAALGLAAGILFAPKKGKDTREQICDGAKNRGDHIIAVVPMFDCCLDDEGCCCDDEDCCEGEFCCEGDDCCVGDECSDDYEVDYETENLEEEINPIKELENEK